MFDINIAYPNASQFRKPDARIKKKLDDSTLPRSSGDILQYRSQLLLGVYAGKLAGKTRCGHPRKGVIGNEVIHLEPSPETADRPHISVDGSLAQFLSITPIAVPGIFVFQCHDEATQVIGADGGHVIDSTQKSDEDGHALFGVDDGALAVATGAGIKAVAGK